MSAITDYLDSVEQQLVQSPLVIRFGVLSRAALPQAGQIRVRADLADGGCLEFFEYVVVEMSGQIRPIKYSYHWQNAHAQLVRRWDNVHHYPHLPHAPHHIHQADGQVEGQATPPDLAAVLSEIEKQLKL